MTDENMGVPETVVTAGAGDGRGDTATAGRREPTGGPADGAPPQSPAPAPQGPCGCRIHHGRVGQEGEWAEIDYCPLHAAAPEMALLLDYDIPHPGCTGRFTLPDGRPVRCVRCELDAAIDGLNTESDRRAAVEAERDRLRAAAMAVYVRGHDYHEVSPELWEQLRVALADAGAGDGIGGGPAPQGGAPGVLSIAGGTLTGYHPPPQSPAPVSGDLRTTYNRFRHLDRLLSDPAWVSGSPVAATLRDLWLAVKAEVESRRGAQAPVPPGEWGGTGGSGP